MINLKALALSASIVFTGFALFAIVGTSPARADKLDDIISAGTIKCGMQVTFAPLGFHNEANQPVGFDADTCNDLGKALGVSVEIVEVTGPDRIPSLLTGRTDVVIGSSSDTLERAKSVGFTIPYSLIDTSLAVRKDLNLSQYSDAKGLRAGGVTGSWEGELLKADVEKWGSGSYKAYQNDADLYLALQQGQIDVLTLATVSINELIKSGKYPNFKLGPVAPYTPDYLAMMAPRTEYGFINYLNLFINQQVRTGRYQELWTKWTSGKPQDLTVPGVYR